MVRGWQGREEGGSPLCCLPTPSHPACLSLALGGRWADSSAFVRRRIKSLTMADSSAARAAPSSASDAAAPGSRPARMGAS